MTFRSALFCLAIFIGGVAAGFGIRAWGWEDTATATKVQSDDSRARAEIAANEFVVVCLNSDSSCRLGDLKHLAADAWGAKLDFNGRPSTCWVIHLDDYRTGADPTVKPDGIAQIRCEDY
jgi:hypothetical protein